MNENINLKHIIGILDNYHDFHDFLYDTKKTNDAKIKRKIGIKFKNFIEEKFKNDKSEFIQKYKFIFNLKQTQETNINFIQIEGNYVNNSSTMSFEKEAFNNFINCNYNLEQIKNRVHLDTIKKTIIENFYCLFGNINIPSNIIIKLRIPLYSLIHKLKNNKPRSLICFRAKPIC